MITTGSKFLIGATVLATVSAVAYGIAQGGVMGTTGLIFAALALAVLTAINMFLRDSNVTADSAVASSCGAALPAPERSVFPLLLAFGATTVAVGLVTYQAIFIVGVVTLLAAGAEWTVQAWAEGASSDRLYNAEVRGRFSNTLEYPLLGAIGVGAIVYSFSRIMLWLSKTNTVVAFSVVASIVIALAFVFAYRPSIKTGAIAGVCSLAAIGIVAGGAAAGIDGERDIHPHETVGALAADAEEPICDSPEEFEADEKSSQTVGSKSGAAASITLTEDGRLVATVPGSNGAAVVPLTLSRSNPTNIIFRNESGEHRRLSLDLGEVPPADGATDGASDAEAGGEAARQQICTALVDEGGAQLLTVTIGVPSFAVADGYHFFVPGVESARLDLVVP